MLLFQLLVFSDAQVVVAAVTSPGAEASGGAEVRTAVVTATDLSPLTIFMMRSQTKSVVEVQQGTKNQRRR